jgi:uncharacterized metal-binding protein YceD (DUF177 family)
MGKLNKYTIQFIGLKLGKHRFTYPIDNKFFDDFQYDDFNFINCNVDLLLIKKPTLMELHFAVKGSANLICDLTNETFDQEITHKMDVIVKFGEFFNDENEDILILPHTSFQLDISQFLYEAIVLSLPIKRVHPGVADGTLKSDVLKKLKEYELNETKRIKEIDPRWDKLNELLTSKKE